MKLDEVANVASILTAVVAAGAAVCYWCDRRSKVRRLEQYLKTEMAKNAGGAAHTMIHLMAELGMAEAEILHASFASRHVKHLVRKDEETGLADVLLFEYSETRKVI